MSEIIKRRGPSKFIYPGLKISEKEVNLMARTWVAGTRKKLRKMSKVEEAILYGAGTNPEQCFRVVRAVCRICHQKHALRSVGVNLIESLMAKSAHKIKRSVYTEFRISQNFRYALQYGFLTKKDKGYSTVSKLVKRFIYV